MVTGDAEGVLVVEIRGCDLLVGKVLIMSIVLIACWWEIKARRHQALEDADKLCKQQAHENRDLQSYAISVLRHMIDTMEKTNPSISDFICQRNELAQALNSLQEVEIQHQNRLSALRILRNQYVPEAAEIDLIDLMVQLLREERDRAHHSKPIEWLLRIPREYGEKNLIVKIDVHILRNILTHLLKNAQKHTHHGHIMLSFHGESNGLCIFHVEDSGSGVPSAIRDVLFNQDVVCGNTLKNTAHHFQRGNIGLPSCSIFANAAGGYLKLLESREQDSHQGYTKFEIAVAGHFINSPNASPSIHSHKISPRQDEDQYTYISLGEDQSLEGVITPNKASIHEDSDPSALSKSTRNNASLPQKATIIVVDDSRMCRCIVIRAMRKVQADRSWNYCEFATIEKAQQQIKDTISQGGWTIVCLDENLSAEGGTLKGIDATRWIVNDLGAPSNAIIISISGEPGTGQKHIELGAHLAWAKPQPQHSIIQSDLERVFTERLF